MRAEWAGAIRRHPAVWRSLWPVRLIALDKGWRLKSRLKAAAAATKSACAD